MAASAYLLLQLKPVIHPVDPVVIRAVMKEHWTYGRWALASAVATWLPWNVYYSVLGRSWGMDSAGEFRAMMNLLLPLGQTLTALSLLALPTASRKLSEKGSIGVLNQASELVMLYGAVSVAYWLLILPLRGPLFRLLYGARYVDSIHLLPWLAAGSVLWFAAFAPPITLRAIQSPMSVFAMYSAASVITLAIGIPAAVAYGIRGAILGTSLSSVTALAAGLFLIRSKSGETATEPVTTVIQALK